MRLDLPHGFKRWHAFEEVERCKAQLAEEWIGQAALHRQLAASFGRWLEGYCAACRQRTRFATPVAREREPNWREGLACKRCRLINRWRASVHLLRLLPRPPGTIYLTEQTTLLFRHLKRSEPEVVGSEFLAADAAGGEIRRWRRRRLHWWGQKLRHEDVTSLSFETASLAALLSFDVLEHIPDYRSAVREFARVLQPGGLLLLTAPFSIQATETVVRARMNPDGSVEHLLPPCYHGDPLSSKGVLCFQDFGWDLVDDLRTAGFRSAEVITCWAPEFGYLGTCQPFIVGWR